MAADESEHSRLGIASLLIGVCSFATAVMLMLATMWIETKRDISEWENQFAIFTVYYILIFMPAAHVAGLIVGICGSLQKKRRKILANMGLVINLLFIVMHLGIRNYFSGMFLR